MTYFNSIVEQKFHERSPWKSISTKIPYVTVNNFPELGLLTAFRFIEWANENPTGLISLPTGKTPEYFIKYTQFLMENWNAQKSVDLRTKWELNHLQRPDLSKLEFVQIDEFYPISPAQHNSFYNYVMNFYVKGFGLDPKKCLLINSDEIPLYNGMKYGEVFPNSEIDLSLRYRDAKTRLEEIQQQSVLMIDNWCSGYEAAIRDKGGIGFFLGGIGPDGHIAFNTRGSDHYSTTRLTPTNFETQAVAAGDLGGIEVAKKRLVITIGLDTITSNKDAVSIIFAAGEAKADIVKASLENTPDVKYPATVLQRQPNSRFYLTTGAACKLSDAVEHAYLSTPWNHSKTERAVIDLCINIDKYAHHITMDDLKNDQWCSKIPDLSEQTVPSVINSVKEKIARGMMKDKNQRIYHTGPHHDDIMLGMMPHTTRQVREASNEVHFSVLTSGFTAVTNSFIIKILEASLELLNVGRIEMIKYPDFFEVGYSKKWDKDVYHFLNNVAKRNEDGKMRGIVHRAVRSIVKIWEVINEEELQNTIHEIITTLQDSYDGSKNPEKIQKLKGMIREFEEELVWAHYGVPVSNIHHLRLGFYKGDIFTEQPDKNRDIIPMLEELRKHQPTILSLAMDPEGSGPDTHYKVLQVIAGAVKEWQKEKDLSDLRILGYRNVWFKYHPAEADIMVPVSLNAMDVLQNSFTDSYLSQVNASFPSYEYDGKFSELTQKIWVNQLNQVQYVLGKNYFYENDLPMMRSTHGFVYLKELTVDEFVTMAEELEKAMEAKPF